jgi:hypothetical protein
LSYGGNSLVLFSLLSLRAIKRFENQFQICLFIGFVDSRLAGIKFFKRMNSSMLSENVLAQGNLLMDETNLRTEKKLIYAITMQSSLKIFGRLTE